MKNVDFVNYTIWTTQCFVSPTPPIWTTSYFIYIFFKGGGERGGIHNKLCRGVLRFGQYLECHWSSQILLILGKRGGHPDFTDENQKASTPSNKFWMILRHIIVQYRSTCSCVQNSMSLLNLEPRAWSNVHQRSSSNLKLNIKLHFLSQTYVFNCRSTYHFYGTNPLLM